jgi:glycopeptide antibiotics resistance protein
MSQPWHRTTFDTGFFSDVIVNLIGLVPLGFLLGVYLSAGTGGRNYRPIVIATLYCFLLSLLIESAQVWMPSRSSQLLDLILNTVGGAAGGMMGSWQLKTEG